MKNKLMFIAISFVFTMSCKKSNDTVTTGETATPVAAANVPTVVKNAFSTAFAGATEVEWLSVNVAGRTERTEYEVEFNHQSQRHDARYDDNGNSRSHSITCTSAPVPQVVLTAFRTRNPNDNVYEWKLNNDGTWKAHFMRGAVKWETTFSASGGFIKEEHD